MKYRVYTFSIALLLLLCQCSKDNVTPAAIDQLPAATQEGKNTFGCLVDGQVFLPKGSSLAGPILSCGYQYINFGNSQGYYLSLGAIMRNGGNDLKGIYIYTDSLSIKQGDVIPLKKARKGGADVLYDSFLENPDEFRTTDTLTGQLVITKLDPVKNILSGTFWFDVINVAGKEVKVSDGRFDIEYNP